MAMAVDELGTNEVPSDFINVVKKGKVFINFNLALSFLLFKAGLFERTNNGIPK